jgi:hypothetical protein
LIVVQVLTIGIISAIASTAAATIITTALFENGHNLSFLLR